jgi:glycosyltransferase involved in cell wall biosynthesis
MGGIETHLQNLCGGLRNYVDLQVLVANDGRSTSEDTVDGVNVSRIGTRLTFASTPICPSLVRKIRASQADIVHCHLPNPATVLAYLASGHPGRLVVTYHSDTVRQKVLGALFEPWLHAALRRSSAIIATSQNYSRSSAVLARYQDRCHVIPYGIPVEEFQNGDSATAREIRERYGDNLVLTVGRLVYYKGLEHLIRSMTHVRGKLLIVGGGPLETDLRKLASSLGLTEKVVFLGEIQNQQIVPYYHAADVFALASVARSEAFGIVQIEAMAAGLPVVNTQLDSGVPFVSLHNLTVLTVAPGNPEALADALNRLLEDTSLRNSFAKAARERAQNEFSLATMSSRTLALYEKVACSAPPVHCESNGVLKS